MTNDDLAQRIRERAYEIWENEGRPQGRSGEHWEQACAEFAEARAEAATEQTIDAGAGTGEAEAQSDTATPTVSTPSTAKRTRAKRAAGATTRRSLAK